MNKGYDGLHDWTGVLFGTTNATRNNEITYVQSNFTRTVKLDLILAKEELIQRGLLHAYSWCADLAVSVKGVKLEDEVNLPNIRHDLGDEIDDFERSKVYFDRREYFRSAHYSEDLKHPLCRFLHLFARYCAYEQKINLDRTDSVTMLPKNTPGPHLKEISQRLGPIYFRVSKKERYPEVSRGIVGVGSYEYKTKLATPNRNNGASTSTQNPGVLNVSVVGPTAISSKRRLRRRIDDGILDDDICPDMDLEDEEVAHLGEDIDNIEIDDTCGDDESRIRVPHEGLFAGDKLAEENISCGYDSFLMYLYGVVLKQLGQRRLASEVFCWSLHLNHRNWASWSELAELVIKRTQLEQLDLPACWQRQMFLAQVFMELNLDADCVALCDELTEQGLRGSTFLATQRALAFRNIRQLELAIAEFEAVERLDPFHVESLDVFSNLLYVKGRRVQLANLAAKMVQVAKYSVETCCVVGNYLSLRGDHEKAVVYFQRALKLNPKFVNAYTLMGHEYMEMKGTQQAIQCYRNALRINRRDYRAWFGLGQMYDCLRLFNYSLYYYKQAQRLHPYDSRMVIALGESFEKKEMFLEAKKCYVKAHSVGDMEGVALLKLARLYERLSENERAADAYDRYLLETEGEGMDEHEDRGRANMFLAEFMLQHGLFDQAEEYAKRCIGCKETQEASKSLLKDITHKRNLAELASDSTVKEESRCGNRARSGDDDGLHPPSLRPRNSVEDRIGGLNRLKNP